MGQKTHPVGFRLGVNKQWNSRWYASDRDFADLVYEDMMIKRYINRRLENAGISGVMISRAPKKVTVDIKTARPGIVIGRRGAEVDKLREELQMLTGKDIALNIVEVRKPELDARLVADSIARQLEGRVSFRRAMKKAVAATMKMGADGIKVQCGGRLGGAEIARTEKYKDGRVPLHTLRADIDYSTATAATTYGCIGVKVWICRGEILGRGPLGGDEEKEEMIAPDASPAARPRRGKAARGQKRRPRGRVRRPEGRPNRGEGEARPRGRRPEGPASRPAPPRPRGGPKDTTQHRPAPPRPKGGPKDTSQHRPAPPKPEGGPKDTSQHRPAPPRPRGGPKDTTRHRPAPPKPKGGPKGTTQNEPAPTKPPDKSGESKKPDAQE